MRSTFDRPRGTRRRWIGAVLEGRRGSYTLGDFLGAGGWGEVYSGPTYETTNGGANWHLAGWGINMNRVRFISDTLAYAVGITVYKYTAEPIGIQQISA